MVVFFHFSLSHLARPSVIMSGFCPHPLELFPKVPASVFYILSLLLDPLSSCLPSVSAYFFSTLSSLTSS